MYRLYREGVYYYFETEAEQSMVEGMLNLGMENKIDKKYFTPPKTYTEEKKNAEKDVSDLMKETAEEHTEKSLSAMKKDELLALAEERGITLAGDETKAELVDLLEGNSE